MSIIFAQSLFAPRITLITSRLYLCTPSSIIASPAISPASPATASTPTAAHLPFVTLQKSQDQQQRFLKTYSPNAMPVKKYGVITDNVVVDGSVKEIFDYLADFSTTEEWDPGCISAKRRETTPLAVGDTFDLVTEFKGKQSKMVYKLDEMVQTPNENGQLKIVVSGEGDIVTGVDTILLKPANKENTKTHVDYEANLALKSWRRPFVVFLSSTFNQLGIDAMAGMEKACAARFGTTGADE